MELNDLESGQRDLRWTMLDVNHNVIHTDDVHLWEKWYENPANRRVQADEDIKDGWELCTDFIQTFLFRDEVHRFGAPFESMVFLLDSDGQRLPNTGLEVGLWESWDDALKGHEMLLKEIKKIARVYRKEFELS